ncbi:MAG: hypothetical protein KIT69_13775 [Propionibacteriaceae bacterium]|nr:hypothetical protein [Propionibacteriaceae bacterium]
MTNLKEIIEERGKKLVVHFQENQDFQNYLMTLALMVIGGQRKELILSFTIEVSDTAN